MSPTIYTLTGNLLWERTLTYAGWAPGKTQRAQSETFQVGGKGINVSRMLARLSAPTEAWCFAGGSTGEDCLAWMRHKGLCVRAFSTTGATRIGAVIRAAGQPETTFLGVDTVPDGPAWEACAQAVRALPDASVLTLCGSFPGWTSPEAAPLRDAILNHGKHATLVVDSYGPPLAWALREETALIKINRDEFDALFPARPGQPFQDRLGEEFQKAQGDAWIITDGAEPVWMIQKGGRPQSFLPPRIEMVSPTGSGDVFLACLLHALHHRRLSLADAIVYALPFASANAAHPGIADFDLNNLPT